MKMFKLSNITKRTTSRDHGSDAALAIIELLHNHIIEKVEASSIDGVNSVTIHTNTDELMIDISDDSRPSASFLDEIIYRLDDKNLLHRFRFRIHNDRVFQKLEKISNDRVISININWNDKRKTIKPSDKPSKAKHKIIHRDL